MWERKIQLDQIKEDKKGSSLFYNTSTIHEPLKCETNDRECETNDTWATRVRQKWKILILITAIVKPYFRTPILAIEQMKDYKKSNNFILRTNFWKLFVPMPKCLWNHKIGTIQWQKLYQNVIHGIVATNVLARCRIIMHSNT